MDSSLALGTLMSDLLFLVPARGGSKGVPKKNVASVGGRPMIAWSIDAALRADHGGRVVVSTDSEEIASVARTFKAEVPFIRPAELATDEASSLDMALHTLEWFARIDNYRPDYLMLLQPTSPLRQPCDIDGAIALAMRHDADAVVSVSPTSIHPYLTKTLDADGMLRNFMNTPAASSRRQEMPAAYVLNGAIFLIKPATLALARTWYPKKTYGYVMPPERGLDVDSPWDLKIADLLMRDAAVHASGQGTR